MASVPARSFRDFATRRIIVEKVVDRRLGYESANPPTAWKWDSRYVIKDKIVETLPFPGLKRSHLQKLPRSYWQNGPIAGSSGNSIKVEEVREIFTNGQTIWAPIIHNGDLNIWRDSTYFFSDDSVIEILTASSLDASGRSTHTLQKVLRPGSPILATIFRRDIGSENLPWRSFTRRTNFTGTYDSDGNEQTTRSGDTIYWSNVDTTKREFISFVRDDYINLQFNQLVVEAVTSVSVPSTIDDFNDLEYVGTSDGLNNQKFETSRFPVSNDSSLAVYVVNTSAGTWTAFSVVTSFSAANQVLLDADLGILTFGTLTGTTPPPTAGYGIYIAYNAVPRIEYEEDGYSDVAIAKTADVSPLSQSLNKGFVCLARTELDIGSIELSTTKSVVPGYANTYGPVYAGADFADLLATVYSSGGEIVPNVEVTFYFETSPPFGGIGGSSTSIQKRTGFDGIARTFYVPPASVDAMGYYVSSLTNSTTLTLPADANYLDVIDVYTYHVLKDDPMLGVVGADTTIGEVEWSPTAFNGRKVIYYKWDATATNPITGYLGSYVPVRPVSITGGNVLTYTDPLATPDPAANSTNLGAFWIISDRFITVRASAYSPRLGRTVYSDPLNFKVELPDYMKGSYINTSLQEFPFGWRIKDDVYEQASAIDGATYISINPVAGPYPIIDVIGGEVWDPYRDLGFGDDPYNPYYWNLFGNVATAPFAHFSLTWEIT
jgi:hypothetical protein